MTPALAVRTVVLAALLVAGTGCRLYHPRPVTFRVRDGDTGAPVPGATVNASYMAMLDFGVLFASIGPHDGVTDAGGDLPLILDARKPGLWLNVTAADYGDNLDGTPSYLGAPTWKRLLPGPGLWSPDEYQVRLFHGSRPTAEVALPDGYRGPVVLRFPADGGPPAGGRRAFAYVASPGGVVEVPHGALFECARHYEGIRARYGAGPPLPTEGTNWHLYVADGLKADDVALRFIRADWDHHVWLYVLGTHDEAEAARRAVYRGRDGFDEAAFLRLVGSR